MAILAEFAVEQEGTPGTAETIVEADVLIRLRSGFTLDIDEERIDPEEIQATSSKRPVTVGRKLASFGVSYQLRGPGDLVTTPTISDLWEAAMFDAIAAKTVAVGSITGGPYLAGEEVEDESSNTGLVLRQTSATPVPYIPLVGTLTNTETLTGAESGATSTIGGTPADAGYAFRPADWNSGAGHHATAKLFRNGYQWTTRGSLATLRLPFRNGYPCFVEQSFTGALTSQGDASLFGVTSFPEDSVTPPRFLDAGILIGSYSPSGILDFDLNLNNTYEAVEDANDSSADGVKYMDYVKARPTITLDPDQVATGTYDYFDTFTSGTTFYFEWTLGSTSGSTWTFSCREAQFEDVGATERSERPRFPLTISLNGNDNNEILIWQH